MADERRERRPREGGQAKGRSAPQAGDSPADRGGIRGSLCSWAASARHPPQRFCPVSGGQANQDIWGFLVSALCGSEGYVCLLVPVRALCRVRHSGVAKRERDLSRSWNQALSDLGVSGRGTAGGGHGARGAERKNRVRPAMTPRARWILPGIALAA